jgi:hypothetical protein
VALIPRTRWIAGGTALVIIAVAAGFMYLRGGSTPVPVQRSVERFREQRSGAEPLDEARPVPMDRRRAVEEMGTKPAGGKVAHVPGAQPSTSVRPLPQEGVYTYATTGGDEVDVAGGSHHDYPARTTITVRHAGCGLIERWDALEERWDERETCPAQDGYRLRRTTSYHNFFRHADERTLTCEGMYAWPGTTAAGTTWKGRCTSEGATTELTGLVVGAESLRVGDRLVDTLHVRVTAKISGDQTGSHQHDVWGSVDTRVVVKETGATDTDSTQPLFGNVHYHERYELRLLSLEPDR